MWLFFFWLIYFPQISYIVNRNENVIFRRYNLRISVDFKSPVYFEIVLRVWCNVNTPARGISRVHTCEKRVARFVRQLRPGMWSKNPFCLAGRIDRKARRAIVDERRDAKRRNMESTKLRIIHTRGITGAREGKIVSFAGGRGNNRARARGDTTLMPTSW